MTAPTSSTTVRPQAGVSRWRQIRDALAHELERGCYAAGERLPSAGELAERFAVHRHTVRQALQALAGEGLVRTEHGRGTFACPAPLRYALSVRTSFTANVEAQGLRAARTIERIETIRATAALAGPLAIARGALVVRITTTGFADELPLTLSRHHFPLARVPDIAAAVRTTGGITAALARCGIAPPRRAHTQISTRPASAGEAKALAMAPGQPVLVTESVDVDDGGCPVQHGLTTFCGSRVALDITS